MEMGSLILAWGGSERWFGMVDHFWKLTSFLYME
jgi:hypothetical protein